MTRTSLPLRRLFKIVNGGTPTAEEKNWGGSIPWATPVDIANKSVSVSETQRTLTQIGARSGSSIVPKGSILLSTRAPIGYTAITEVSMAFNQGCRALVPLGEVDVRFFRYQLEAREDDLQAAGMGTTFVELSSGALAGVEVNCPEFEEQRRIADFLDSEVAHIVQVVEARLRQLELLEERSRSVVDHEIDYLVSQWGVVPFRRIIRKIEQGSSPQCEAVPAGVEEWGVLKLSSIKRGKFHPSENKKLPEDVEADVRFRLSSGDLLVTRANTPELVGDAAVVQGNHNKLLLSDLVYRICFDESVGADYLCAIIRGSRVRGFIQAAARGSSQSMVKLRGEDIRSWNIPVANEREQMNFVARVKRQQDEVDTIGSKIERQITLLKERKRALITAAVTGQIDVTTARGADLS